MGTESMRVHVCAYSGGPTSRSFPGWRQPETCRESGGAREGGPAGFDLFGFVFDFLLTLEMD